MQDGGGEAFGSREQEVVWEGFGVGVGVGSGEEAFRWGEAGGFGEGD